MMAEQDNLWEGRLIEALYSILARDTAVPEDVDRVLARLTLSRVALADLAVEVAGRSCRRIAGCEWNPEASVGADSLAWIEALTGEALILVLPSPANAKPRAAAVRPGVRAAIPHPDTGEGPYLVAVYLVGRTEALFTQAEALREQSAWGAALETYERVLKLDSGHWQALRGKAFVLREFKQREEALRCAEESVRLNPGYALGWRTRGALLRDLGRHEEGLDCYDRALAIDPDDPVTLQNRRNALEALGRPVTQSPKASPARSGK